MELTKLGPIGLAAGSNKAAAPVKDAEEAGPEDFLNQFLGMLFADNEPARVTTEGASEGDRATKTLSFLAEGRPQRFTAPAALPEGKGDAPVPAESFPGEVSDETPPPPPAEAPENELSELRPTPPKADHLVADTPGADAPTFARPTPSEVPASARPTPSEAPAPAEAVAENASPAPTDAREPQGSASAPPRLETTESPLDRLSVPLEIVDSGSDNAPDPSATPSRGLRVPEDPAPATERPQRDPEPGVQAGANRGAGTADEPPRFWMEYASLLSSRGGTRPHPVNRSETSARTNGIDPDEGPSEAATTVDSGSGAAETDEADALVPHLKTDPMSESADRNQHPGAQDSTAEHARAAAEAAERFKVTHQGQEPAKGAEKGFVTEPAAPAPAAAPESPLRNAPLFGLPALARPDGGSTFGNLAPAEIDMAHFERTVTDLVESIRLQKRSGHFEMEFDLKPDFLGRARFEVRMANNEMQALLRVEDPAVRQALEGRLPWLQQQLDSAGVSIQSIQIALFSEGFSSNLNHEAGGNPGDAKSARRSGRKPVSVEAETTLTGEASPSSSRIHFLA